MSTNLQLGYRNTLKLSPGFSGSARTEYWKAWIDFDRDGLFSDEEAIVSQSSNGTISRIIEIPATADPCRTRMRVTMSPDGYPPAHRAFYNGEPEDYTVYLIASEYNPSWAESQEYEWIKNVYLSGIDNQSDDRCYSNFLHISTDLRAGQSYQIRLTPGFSDYSYDEYWNVWIDFNKDNNFEANEKVFSGYNSSYVDGIVNIPSAAEGGTTRMRVLMRYYEYPPSPEGSIDYGEVEDYSVYIIK